MTGKRKFAIAWTVLGIAWLAVFAALESYALTHDDALSLSQFVWNISHRWPPFVFLCGLTVGILVSHFWWRWNPDEKSKS